MKTTRSDVIPTKPEELMLYKNYIIGGLRNLNVSDEDIDDRLQDVLLHCLASNFLLRVKEKVDAGLMNPKQFRAYLGTTIHNVLINEYKRDTRDPAIGAIPTDVGDGSDDSDYRHSIDLGRHHSDDENRDYSIPSSVIEDDIIRFVAERKPAFVPTLILYLQDHRPADIARIIGKKKETIHYRMKAIFQLLEEYFEERAAPAQRASEADTEPQEAQVAGTTYMLIGENPFHRGSLDELYRYVRTLNDTRGSGITLLELVFAARRLMEQGRFVSKRTPENVAETFLVETKAKGVLREVEVVARESRSTSSQRRCKYEVLTSENPYKWETSSGYILFEQVKHHDDVCLTTLTTMVQALLDTKQIESKRSAVDIAWGFIETARGYQAIRRMEG